MMNFFYQNQLYIPNHPIIQINNQYNIARSTIKIRLNNNEIGSGFLLKFIRNYKPFYCLMTNQHVISPYLVQNKSEILVKYDNEMFSILLKLDREERIIFCFEEVPMINADVTLVEIIPKDNIQEQYFLMPNIDYSYLPNFIQNIKVVQYPLGRFLSVSDGRILGLYIPNKIYFFHNASTQGGSSGGPIVLDGDDKVIAIHKGTNYTSNIGIFIKNIVLMMQGFKKNGKYKEFYSNGNLKYEGNFIDDEYNDNNGQFHFENGNIYIGQFKDGQKHGKGILLNNKFQMIRKCEYNHDIEINNIIIQQNDEGGFNNNINNNNNFNINNNNNNENFNQNFNIVVKGFSDLLHPLGNMLGVLCTKCQHPSQNHDRIESGTYFCRDCEEICAVREINFA